MDNKTENKRYYWNCGDSIFPVEKLRGGLGYDSTKPTPCSPELIQLLGKDAREVILGKDFELQYEYCAVNDTKEWCLLLNKQNYDNYVGLKRITAIPVKAVEGVGNKLEEEGKIAYQLQQSFFQYGNINQLNIVRYLASLEYRINQIEKKNK